MQISRLVACFAAVCLWNGSASAQTISVFQVPGADITTAEGISATGIIAGTYYVSTPDFPGQESHGYVRQPGGRISSFDPPDSLSTFVTGISETGQVIGAYIYDRRGRGDIPKTHGFVRERDGTITIIDPPGSLNTLPLSINAAGEISGQYMDDLRSGDPNTFGFVRNAAGEFERFLDRIGGASINASGVIVGTYHDRLEGRNRGYIRDPIGNVTFLDAGLEFSTSVQSINDKGMIVGSYFQPDLPPGDPGFGTRGLVVGKHDDFTTFVAGQGDHTLPVKINDHGIVVGQFGSYGFVRDRSGDIELFAVPGATSTQPSDLNKRGQIVGSFFDPETNLWRAFRREPK